MRSRFVAQNLRGTDISPLNGDHGEQWQHPVIVGNTVYLRPYAFDLHSGRSSTTSHIVAGTFAVA